MKAALWVAVMMAGVGAWGAVLDWRDIPFSVWNERENSQGDDRR
jgi:hypothetical protein